MECGNTTAAPWHHGLQAPTQLGSHYNAPFYVGANGHRGNCYVDESTGALPNCTYQQYPTATMMLPSKVTTMSSCSGSSCANLVVASGSGASGYGHGMPMGYPHVAAQPNAAVDNYSYPGAMQVVHGGQTVFCKDPASSNNRIERNKAEKQRRDKLNGYIQELAALVPMVSNSPKKLDKTTVLRLAVTYLRMYWVLPATINTKSRIPPYLIHGVNWSEFLRSYFDGDLLVVTSGGRIVFFTQNMENILGYTQTELMGASLFTITSPEDHDVLKKALKPDGDDDSTGDHEDFHVTSSETITNPGSSHSYATSRNLICSASSSSHDSDECASVYDKQRRSFYLRLTHRTSTRSEQPQYELVRIQGQLRVPIMSEAQKKARKNDKGSTVEVSLLVATMERIANRRVTELSVIEPSKDEYVTRHTLLGQILFSDQRISTVAGYFSDEVNGFQAFNFMHPEDAPWVALALYEMFKNGEAFGLSCFRLQRKNKSFIYLKSYGYLEYDPNTETYGSFICVNSRVTEEEGERALTEMRTRYRPLLESSGPDGSIPAELCRIVQKQRPLSCDSAPINMDALVEELISQVGALKPDKVHEDPDKSDQRPYTIAKIFSRNLPPTMIHLQNVKQNSPAGSSQRSPSTPSSPSQPQLPQPKQECQHWSSTSSAGSPPAASCSQKTQDRPSVLRIAPSKSSGSVTVYSVDNKCISSRLLSNCATGDNATCNGGRECGDCGISSNASGSNEQRLYGNCGNCEPQQPEFIKKEMPDDQILSTLASIATASSNESSGADVSWAKNGTAKEQTSCDRVAVVVQRASRGGEKYSVSGNGVDGRSSVKRPHGLLQDTSSSVPTQKRYKEENFEADVLVSTLLPPPSHPSPFPSASMNLLAGVPQTVDSDSDLNVGSESQYRDLTNILGIDPLDPRFAEVFDFQPPNKEELDQMHIKVESTLRIQKSRINDIRNNVQDLPQTYRDRVNEIDRERETQGQYLQEIQYRLHNVEFSPSRV